MAFTIDKFRAGALAKGGARANLFEVSIKGVGATGSLSAGAINEFRFACKAAAIPAMAVATVDVPYFGRVIKVPGNKTFENWAVTIINDEGFAIRNGMEKWIAAMGTHEGNVATIGTDFTATGGTLFGNATVTHYDKSNDKTIAEYKFLNIFPVSIGEIALGWDANDAIEEITVEFAYDYWTQAGEVTT